MTIPARGSRSVHADALFDGFVDLTYAYRFGPPGHDVVAATLRESRDRREFSPRPIAFRAVCPRHATARSGSSPRAEPITDGYALVLKVDRFAHAVAIEAEGFVPDDNYLHLEPGEPRRLAPARRGARTASPWQRLGAERRRVGIAIPIAQAEASDAALSQLRPLETPRGTAALHHARWTPPLHVASSRAAEPCAAAPRSSSAHRLAPSTSALPCLANPRRTACRHRLRRVSLRLRRYRRLCRRSRGAGSTRRLASQHRVCRNGSASTHRVERGCAARPAHRRDARTPGCCRTGWRRSFRPLESIWFGSIVRPRAQGLRQNLCQGLRRPGEPGYPGRWLHSSCRDCERARGVGSELGFHRSGTERAGD